MKPASRLTMDFAHRMVDDLATNNTLRGAWAEQLVAHFLGITKLPPNWSYYDMRDDVGRDISVKHSVGKEPQFSVAMNTWAWDAALRERRPESEGWYRAADESYQYWCHTYTFAWLDHDDSAPELDIVLDSERWRFAVLGRDDMYARFPASGGSGQKKVGLSTLNRESFRPGIELPEMVGATLFRSDAELVPPRSMVEWKSTAAGAPTDDVISEVVPEAFAG